MNPNLKEKEKFKKLLPQLILSFYHIYLPAFIIVMLAFVFSDIYLREVNTLAYYRILPITLALVLFVIKFSKYSNHLRLIVTLNNLFCISILMMGYQFIVLFFDTPIFRSSLIAFVIFIFIVFFIAKGKRSIVVVYLVPLVLMIIYTFLVLKPEAEQLQEMMNPLAIYIAVFVVSLQQERSRFNEFHYQESLIQEKEKTSDLYIDTAIKNDKLLKQKDEILNMNKLLEQKSEELQINLEVISELNTHLKKKNKSITDSINYASRIQETILPSDENLSKILKDYFILYKPCDIVSGDFYWMHSCENFDIIAAVDCTGHGVPGGFMSMFGFSLLNDVIQNCQSNGANEILNVLKVKLTESLNQSGENTNQADGLEIALCLIDRTNNKIQFSGANMPFTLVRDNELIHYKGDKVPIGLSIRRISSFTNHEIPYLEGDKFYMYSDGYQDQMGGENNKRFLSSNLKKLILNNSNLSFVEQKEILNNSIEQWRGKQTQSDDIMVIGFEL